MHDLLPWDTVVFPPPRMLDKIPIGIADRRRHTKSAAACCLSPAVRAQHFCWEIICDVALSEQQASGLDANNVFILLYIYFKVDVFLVNNSWHSFDHVGFCLAFHIYIFILSSCIRTLAFLLQIHRGPSEMGIWIMKILFYLRPLFTLRFLNSNIKVNFISLLKNKT